MTQESKLLEYVGVIHIHTTDSDGSKTHEQIIAMAQKYAIDFLMFSDHMTLAHKSIENWHDRTLVIVGYEHEDEAGRNHYLAFGLNETLPKNRLPREYVNLVHHVGGFGIIAHPDEKRNFPEYPPLPWTDWSVRHFDAIEIWNHMSAWLEGIADGNKLKYLLNPRSMLVAPPAETLKRWDKLALKRRILGIGAADAHGHKQKIWGPIWRTIFPYSVELRFLRTHVLMKEPLSRNFDEAKKQLFRALNCCRVFISNYRWGDATGFRFWAQTPQMQAIVGDRIVIHSGLRFFVNAPGNADMRLIRNGEPIAEAKGSHAEFAADRLGAYRVELRRRGKGWIFSNHIRVVPPGQDFRGKGGHPKSAGKPRGESKAAKPIKRHDEYRKKAG